MLRKLSTGVLTSFLCISSVFANDVSYTTNYSGSSWHTFTNTNTDCELISGDNRAGVVIAGGNANRVMSYINSYATGHEISIRDPGMTVSHLAGNNSQGPIVAHNKTVKYLNNYKSMNWSTLTTAPFFIEGLAGDNASGAIVFNDNRLAVMTNYSANRWRELNTLAPFQIKGIDGDNRRGVVAFSASNEVAYLNNYNGQWKVLPTPPVSGTIIDITGDNYNGLAIVTDIGEVQYLNSYRAKKWYNVGNSFPSVKKITGENRSGVAVCK
jgi:hypothetical protein